MITASSRVHECMTTGTHFVGADQPLSVAEAAMHKHAIRHLPVLSGGRLVGMLTQRDLALIAAMDGVNLASTRVEDAMTSEVYAVSPDTSLQEVAREMAAKKYGSAVVMQAAKVVGIVTTVDICNALANVLTHA